jgi:hypothetical protein
MNEIEQKLLERAIIAETQAKFLLEALKKIKLKSPFDSVYHIAESAINGYNKSKNKMLKLQTLDLLDDD